VESSPEEYRRISENISLLPTEVEGGKRPSGECAQNAVFLTRKGVPLRGFPRSFSIIIPWLSTVPGAEAAGHQARAGALGDLRLLQYYNALTTGDLSLSPCIPSVTAAKLGYTEEEYRYFSMPAGMDLDDVSGNVSEGLQIARYRWSWLCRDARKGRAACVPPDCPSDGKVFL
jgi:hypothetical protein